MNPASPDRITDAAHAIGRALHGRRWRGTSELAIADEMEALLAAATFTPPLRFERELVLTAADRLDFAAVLEDGTPDLLAIEVKIQTARVMSTASQVQRYLAHERVGGLILATTSARLSGQFPRELRGKPVFALLLPRM